MRPVRCNFLRVRQDLMFLFCLARLSVSLRMRTVIQRLCSLSLGAHRLYDKYLAAPPTSSATVSQTNRFVVLVVFSESFFCHCFHLLLSSAHSRLPFPCLPEEQGIYRYLLSLHGSDCSLKLLDSSSIITTNGTLPPPVPMRPFNV